MTTTTTTAFVTYTSTTTIVLPSGAPSGNLTYLAISRAVNLGATYALSDLGTHMTDNYYTPTKREIFVLSSAGRLFSVTNDAYYYPQVGGTMLFCYSGRTSVSQGSTAFFGRYNNAQQKIELYFQNPQAAANTSYAFCVSTTATTDSNTGSGFHVNYYPSAASFPSTCLTIGLYLEPT